ncbi:MAG: hypothetical protein K2I26_09680 [Paramuribaculum sp.]|nr:hypothetical protein [Paramuribaculum sp.]
MDLFAIKAGVLAFVVALAITSCSKEEYTPLSTTAKACAVEIECVGEAGENLLADKSFSEKVKVEGEASHSSIPFQIRNNRLCFDAELPDQSEMEWSEGKRDAVGVSRMTLRFGKHKASLKCYMRYVANRPPAAAGGRMTLESLEYNGATYRRNGGSVALRLSFSKSGGLMQ